MSNQSRRERIEDMLRETPDDDGFLRYGLAMEYKAEGDLEKAVTCFRELLQAAPDYVPAYMQLGQLLNQLEREDEAKAVYREGIATAQRKGDTHAAGEMSGFLALLE
jgi:Tfp pilus assembly protein PilF